MRSLRRASDWRRPVIHKLRPACESHPKLSHCSCTTAPPTPTTQAFVIAPTKSREIKIEIPPLPLCLSPKRTGYVAPHTQLATNHQLNPPTDTARAQEGRQSRYSRARKGKRPARQSPKAHVHRTPHIYLSAETVQLTLSFVVPELPSRARQLKQNTTRSPRCDPRCDAMAQGEVLAQ